MTRDELLALVSDQAHVRVYYRGGGSGPGQVAVEGDVIACSLEPMICVSDEDGARHWEVASLPIAVRRVEWDMQ